VRARWLAGVVIVGFVGFACNRVAEEPPSQMRWMPSAELDGDAAGRAVASSGAPAPTIADRCVVPTPSAAPPPVAKGPAPGCPSDPNPHTLATVTVRFPDARAAAGGVRMTAELARRPQDLERGLMYRTHMDEDHGMLFDLGVRQVHTFWMRNTCIPLDMIFLDDDGLVVGIVENAPTLNDAARSVECPATHVLEVNAGWSRRHGVQAGDRAVLPGA